MLLGRSVTETEIPKLERANKELITIAKEPAK